MPRAGWYPRRQGVACSKANCEVATCPFFEVGLRERPALWRLDSRLPSILVKRTELKSVDVYWRLISENSRQRNSSQGARISVIAHGSAPYRTRRVR
jgi:hypothetical protein